MIFFKQVKILKGHTDLIESLVFSYNHNSLLTAGRDGKLLLWDTKLQKSYFSWSPYDGIELYHADLSEDTRFVLACFSQYKEVKVYDRISEQIFCIPLLEYCQYPRFSIKNTSIISHTNRFVYQIDFCNHSGVKCLFKPDSKIKFFHFFKSRKLILISTQRGIVYIIDTQTGLPIAIIPHTYSNITFVSVSADDSLVFIGDIKNRCIDIWKIDIHPLKIHIEHVRSYKLEQEWSKEIFGCDILYYGSFYFTDMEHAFVCSYQIHLAYINLSHKQYQILGELGYCDTIAIDEDNKIVYCPCNKEQAEYPGSLGVFSYCLSQTSTLRS
jgi:WD40 repeat protein